jgi:hypothetical protein
MTNGFSMEEWMQLVFLPLDTVAFVAGIDEEIDEAEVEAFRKQLQDGPRLKNPLHRRAMEDLARVERAIVDARAAGVDPGSKAAFVVGGEDPRAGAVVVPEDHGDRWLDTLREAADRTRYGSVSEPRGGTAMMIMMPTGGMATAPPGFDAARDLLKGKLTDHEYEYFIASLLISAIEIAKASGGEGPASISTEENVALQTFCSWFGVGPEVIPRHFGG